MTIRTAASGVIKLLGLYFAADATIGIFSSVAFLVVPRPQGVMTGVQYAFGAALGGWIGAAFVAAFFIFRGDDIARLVFEEQLLPAPTVAADDLLRIGISLLGVGIAASGVPTLARAAATALWNIGASRQAGFADAMRRF